jgi:positive regulator of sigma E activity
MNRTATVVEISPALKVRNDDIPSAKSAVSRRFWGVRDRSYTASNPDNLPVSPGDTVELHLPPGRTVAASALLFLFPLLLFPLGFYLASALIPGRDEGTYFLVGFAALLAGLPFGALVRAFAGRLISGGMSAVPEVVRVLTPAEALSCKTRTDSCGSCKACG